jgi:hypothetical protein
MCAILSLYKRPSIFIRGKANLSSERMLYKDYDRKCSVEKNLVVSLEGFVAKMK